LTKAKVFVGAAPHLLCLRFVLSIIFPEADLAYFVLTPAVKGLELAAWAAMFLLFGFGDPDRHAAVILYVVDLLRLGHFWIELGKIALNFSDDGGQVGLIQAHLNGEMSRRRNMSVSDMGYYCQISAPFCR
jgi:hypothetical protein